MGLFSLIREKIGGSRGSIEIQLDKHSYSKGSELTGKIRLLLKKPLEATSLNIELVAIEQAFCKTPSGSRITNVQEAMKINKKIAGAGIFKHLSTYSFSIKIPKKINSIPATQILNREMFENSIFIKERTYTWKLTAQLHVSGFNVIKHIDVDIR